VAFAAAACIVLAGYNNLAGARPWHRQWYPTVNALAATGMLAAAAASGLTATDLGLRRDRLRAGLRLGSAAAAPVVAAFGLAALTPATRPLLNDQRIAGLDRRQLAYHVLLRIPVGTVAWEEIAFRGVLQAALRRVLAEPAATAVGSAVFGLWHIRPTAEALAVNRLAAGRGARITAVTAVAAGTAGAGALLSLLQERSGSLAAPVLLHLAANCAAPLASALARPTDDRPPRMRRTASDPIRTCCRPRLHRRCSRGVAVAARDPFRALTPSAGRNPGAHTPDFALPAPGRGGVVK
jgi:membrane protease YdiL (CAAX protease family)